MNQKGFANIILVIVIVILVGAVGYFALVKKSEQVAQQPAPTPTNGQNLIPTKFEYSTHTSATFGLNFRYPKDYTVIERANGIGIVKTVYLNSGTEGPFIRISESGDSVSVAFERLRKSVESDLPGFKIDSDTQIQIGKYNVRKVEYPTAIGLDFTTYLIAIPTGVISINSAGEDKVAENIIQSLTITK